MDLDKAKKATHILSTIEVLTKERTSFENCAIFKGILQTNDGSINYIYWDPHAYSGRYIKHIIAGINGEIEELRDELNRL